MVSDRSWLRTPTSSRERRTSVAVKGIATESGHMPAQIALAWTLLNPAVSTPLLGTRSLKQLEDNLGALAPPL
jgi:aryl-alcohol dehydrogenase-like predicted oxidoreductase